MKDTSKPISNHIGQVTSRCKITKYIHNRTCNWLRKIYLNGIYSAAAFLFLFRSLAAYWITIFRQTLSRRRGFKSKPIGIGAAVVPYIPASLSSLRPALLPPSAYSLQPNTFLLLSFSNRYWFSFSSLKFSSTLSRITNGERS